MMFPHRPSLVRWSSRWMSVWRSISIAGGTPLALYECDVTLQPVTSNGETVSPGSDLLPAAHPHPAG